MKTSSSTKLLTLALLLLGATQSFATETSAAAASQPAQPVATVTPSYPYLMRRIEAPAEVTVLYTVDPKGAVTGAKIVDSNNAEFNAPTLEAIKKWTFVPALKDGQPVETRVKQTFTFSVRDQPDVSTTTLLASAKKAR